MIKVKPTLIYFVNASEGDLGQLLECYHVKSGGKHLLTPRLHAGREPM